MSYYSWLLLRFLLLSSIALGRNSIVPLLGPDYIVQPLETKRIGIEEIIIDFSSIKVYNIKRKLFGGGNFTHKEDMDNTFVRRLDTFYSSKGNNDFKRLPFRIKETPMCEYYNTTWRNYFEPLFIGKTNFPILPPQGLCPIPKGDYWAKDISPNEDIWPPHLPRGLWRIEDRLYRTQPKRQLIGGIDIYLRTLDRQG